jgi:hypothetical protein
MPRARTNFMHIAIAGVLAGVIACSDRDIGTVPLAPSPAVASSPLDQQEIRMRSITPGSGATLTVTPCTVSTGYSGMCVADQVRLTFDLEFSHDVANPVVSASLYPDPNGNGRWCAWGRTTLAAAYRAGSRVEFTIPILSLSTEDGAPICPLPTTTTVLSISLFERPGYDLLEQLFPVAYTFVSR